ncbi:MAG: hypothetical protein AAGB15_04550 [Pseudomonadota bacterium]
MADITDRESLEAWLNARPEETQRGAAKLISARVAIRLTPLLFRTRGFQHHLHQFVLPAFRALAVSGAAIRQPNTSLHSAAVLASKMAEDAHAADLTINAAAMAARVVCSNKGLATLIANLSGFAHFEATDAELQLRQARAHSGSGHAAEDHTFEAIKADAAMLETGKQESEIADMQLWPMRVPSWAVEGWKVLEGDFLNAPNHEYWHVWIDWYQARLDGDWIKPHTMELERAIALIHDDIWKAGPATANAEIARLIKEHTPKTYQSSDPDAEPDPAVQIAATEPYARLNFGYDDEARRMVRTPFPQDPPPPDDPYRLRDYSGLLTALKNRATELASDLRQDQPQVPKALGRDLRRYAKYAGVDHAELEPRDLIALGEALATALADDDIRMGLGNYLLSKLDRFVRDHQTFAAAFYAALVERSAAVEKVDVLEHTSLEVLEATLADAKVSIETADQEEPAAPDDYLELLEQQATALRDGRLKLDMKTQAAIKAEGARQLSGPYVEALATAARFMAQRVQAISEHGLMVGAARIGGTLSLVEKILGLLRIGS